MVGVCDIDQYKDRDTAKASIVCSTLLKLDYTKESYTILGRIYSITTAF